MVFSIYSWTTVKGEYPRLRNIPGVNKFGWAQSSSLQAPYKSPGSLSNFKNPVFPSQLQEKRVLSGLFNQLYILYSPFRHSYLWLGIEG